MSLGDPDMQICLADGAPERVAEGADHVSVRVHTTGTEEGQTGLFEVN